MTNDLVLRLFAFGELPFQRLVSEFRTRIFEEVAASTALAPEEAAQRIAAEFGIPLLKPMPAASS